MDSRNRRQGFTLIELLVVLVIVGLVAGLGVPRLFNSLGSVNLKTSARKTVSILKYARDTAFYKKQLTKVVVDLDHRKLAVLVFQEVVPDPEEEKEADPDEPPFLFQEKKMEWVEDKALSFPEGVFIKECVKDDDPVSSGKFDLLFSPVGNSSGGEIHLMNTREKEFIIAIDFITGSAQIIQ